MSKAVRIVIFIVGVVLVGAALGALGIYSRSAPEVSSDITLVSESFSPYEISEIDADIDVGDIKLTTGKSGKVEVKSYTDEKSEFSATVEGGTLVIKRRTEPVIVDLSSITIWSKHPSKPVELEIALPEEFDGSVSVNVITGDMVVSDLDLSGNLSFSTTTGDTSIRNTDCGGSLTISSTTGDTVLGSVECDGALTVTGTIGDRRFNYVSATTANVECTTGDISISHLDVSQGLDFSTTTGDIFCRLDDSMDDYDIRSSVVTGDNNLPSRSESGDKKLTVNVITGDVVFVFDD